MEHIKRAVNEILATQGKGIPGFVWNILEISNVNTSQLNIYYDFIRDFCELVDGDIVEYGVYRGASLISTALLLKSLGSKKKVYGFDSFAGFPPQHFNDDKARFKDLLDKGEITTESSSMVRDRGFLVFGFPPAMASTSRSSPSDKLRLLSERRCL